MDDQGAVRSIQAADLTMPAGELDAIWSPMHLERLARTYWKYLSRVTLGLIRVDYTPTERAVVLHRPPVRAAALPRAGVRRWTTSTASSAGGSATASSSRPRATRATATSRSTSAAPASDEPGRAQAARRGRDRVVLPGDRAPDRALGLREHAVAHPRARHARLPALARAARARGVRGRPLRRRAGATQRRSTSATRRGRSSARSSPPVAGASRCLRRPLIRGVAGERAQLARGRGATGSAAPCPSAAHDERLGARAARALVADALEHVAVGHAGGARRSSCRRARGRRG